MRIRIFGGITLTEGNHSLLYLITNPDPVPLFPHKSHRIVLESNLDLLGERLVPSCYLVLINRTALFN
jgi:hypothetical protein